MSLVPLGDDDGPYTDSLRMGLLTVRLDLRRGRLMDHDEVKKRLGL